MSEGEKQANLKIAELTRGFIYHHFMLEAMKNFL